MGGYWSDLIEQPRRSESQIEERVCPHCGRTFKLLDGRHSRLNCYDPKCEAGRDRERLRRYRRARAEAGRTAKLSELGKTLKTLSEDHPEKSNPLTDRDKLEDHGDLKRAIECATE